MSNALSLKKQGLTSNQLKWIAIVCMLIDHIAWSFVATDSVLGQIMHTIGRVTAPIMCFLLVEGFYHTKNVNKYLLRLFIFALASWIPFSLFMAGRLFTPYLGMIWTLFLALVALKVCKGTQPAIIKVLCVIGLCFLSIFGDWQIFGVLYVLCFGLNRGNFKKQVVWFSVISVMMFITMIAPAFLADDFNVFSQTFLIGVFLPLPLIYIYNGKLGGEKLPATFNRWVFYIFYPAHLLIIYLFSLFIK